MFLQLWYMRVLLCIWISNRSHMCLCIQFCLVLLGSKLVLCSTPNYQHEILLLLQHHWGDKWAHCFGRFRARYSGYWRCKEIFILTRVLQINYVFYLFIRRLSRHCTPIAHGFATTTSHVGRHSKVPSFSC